MEQEQLKSFNKKILLNGEKILLAIPIKQEQVFVLTNFRLFYNLSNESKDFKFVYTSNIHLFEKKKRKGDSPVTIITKTMEVVETFPLKSKEIEKIRNIIFSPLPGNFSPSFLIKDTVGKKRLYNCISEFKRIVEKGKKWRISKINENFSFCETYPSYFIVPETASDELLMEERSQRSKKRIPILSWINKKNGCSMLRCSQLFVGLNNNASTNYLEEIKKTGNTECGLCICDLRPHPSKALSKFKNGGYVFKSDLIDEYGNIEIENIHVMRKCFKELMENIINVTMKRNKNTKKIILRSKSFWVGHTKKILDTSVKVTKILEKKHVLINDSDSWDRTSQVVSLVQVLQDPFFRTIEGIITLIEKEWLQCGHPLKRFSMEDNFLKENLCSPIFFQFLECLVNIIQQNPNEFEFGSELLLFIIDNIYSQRFSNFLYNSEKERIENCIDEGNCMWNFILCHRDDFTNESFSPNLILLKIDLSKVDLWKEYWFRNSVILQNLFQYNIKTKKNSQNKEIEKGLSIWENFADCTIEYSNQKVKVYKSLLNNKYSNMDKISFPKNEMKCNQNDISRVLWGIKEQCSTSEEYYGLFIFFESLEWEEMMKYVIHRINSRITVDVDVVIGFLELIIQRENIPSIFQYFDIERLKLLEIENNEKITNITKKISEKNINFLGPNPIILFEVFKKKKCELYSKKERPFKIESKDNINSSIHLSVVLRDSNFFQVVLSFPSDESKHNSLKIEALNSIELEAFIKFLYSGKIDIKDLGEKENERINRVFNLLFFSEMYFEELFKYYLVNILVHWLNENPKKVSSKLKTFKEFFRNLPVKLRKEILDGVLNISEKIKKKFMFLEKKK